MTQASERIFLSPPHMGPKEGSYLQDAFQSNWIAPLGPYVNQFEQKISDYLHGHHTAALSSGTAAIHLALISLGLKAGDVVLCSSFTFCASINPAIYIGCEPVFIDSEEDTWNMSPELLRKSIQDLIAKNKKPKAVILVHLYGMPAHIEEIQKICREYEIALIEDAAEALGSKVNGHRLGTFGDFGVLSFNGNKIITTSGGGALLSQHKAAIEKIRFLSTQARENAPHYEHKEIGYNYRLSNLCAAVGCGQMEVLEERVQRRRAVYANYEKAFKNQKGFYFLDEPKNYFSNRWLSCLLIGKESGTTREEIRLTLESQNIESRPLWKPMHAQPVFKGALSYTNGVSDKLFEQGLCLPSGTAMTEAQQNKVIELIRSLTK